MENGEKTKNGKTVFGAGNGYDEADMPGGNAETDGRLVGVAGDERVDTDAADVSLNLLLQENAGLQSQFDRAVSRALNTARSNWDKERQEAAKRTAGMVTAEREQALNERERALAARERRAGAVATLGERGLPVELADCLLYEDDASLGQSLEAVEKAFSLQVQRAVSQRMKGTPPRGVGQSAYASQMRAALGLK